MNRTLILVTLLATLTAPSIKAAELVTQLHGLSYHADREYDHNEVNPGLALRYYPNKPVVGDHYTIGVYKNSSRRQSEYLGVGWEYEVSEYLTLGVTTGLITGYKQADVLPFLVPNITFFDRIHIVAAPYPEAVMAISIDIFRYEIQ